MTTNLLIGLGGTGAKIAESFLHLCAAGLGPKETYIAFVDQDRANGNSARAHETLKRYIAAYDVLQNPNSGFDLNYHKDIIFKTRVRPLQNPNVDVVEQTGENALDACHWKPHRQNSLAELINFGAMSPDAKDVARLFFASGSEELEMELEAGYRGRPHLGSAALLGELKDAQWAKNLDSVIERGRNNDVNIFLCGSAFGGTGAAALPTLARHISAVAKEKQATRVSVSASLALPYFSFADPEDKTDNVAKASYLPQQTKAALGYYRNLIADEPEVFSKIHLFGWEPLFRINYHSAGQKDQRNPPLAPELLAALAGCQTLDTIAASRGSTTIRVMSRSSRDTLGWNDLPSDVSEVSVRDRIASFLRFQLLFNDEYYGAINQENKKKKGLGLIPAGRAAWYKALFDKDFKNDAAAMTALTRLKEYAETYLQYKALMAAYSNDLSATRGMFKLWRENSIGDVDLKDARGEVKGKGSLGQRGDDFNILIYPASTNEMPFSPFLDLAEALDNFETDTKGVGAFMSALYSVARIDQPVEEA